MEKELNKCKANIVFLKNAKKQKGIYEISIVYKGNEASKRSFYIGKSTYDIEKRWISHIGSIFVNPEQWGADTLINNENVIFEFDIINDDVNQERSLIQKNGSITQQKQGKVTDKLLASKEIASRIMAWLNTYSKELCK